MKETLKITLCIGSESIKNMNQILFLKNISPSFMDFPLFLFAEWFLFAHVLVIYCCKANSLPHIVSEGQAFGSSGARGSDTGSFRNQAVGRGCSHLMP